MLKGSMARGSVLVSYYCVTNHPKTQKLKSISTDVLTGLSQLDLHKRLLSAVGHVGGSSDCDWMLQQVWGQLAVDWSRMTSAGRMGLSSTWPCTLQQASPDPVGPALE